MPTGDHFYELAAEQYFAFAGELHEVLMSVHDGQWQVWQGDYGALPGGCQFEPWAVYGYSFTATRTVQLTDVDGRALVQQTRDLLLSLGRTVDYTESPAAATGFNVTGSKGDLGTIRLSVKETTGEVRVRASTPCRHGSATELAPMVWADHLDLDFQGGRLLPATEGPDSVLLFYFPPDGPRYYDENWDPVDPQPLVTSPQRRP